MIVLFVVDAPAIGVAENIETPNALRAAFERYGEKVSDFQPLFESLIPVLEEAEERQFAGQGVGPIGGSWAPLTPAYEKQKDKKWGAGKPILEASGNLRAALTEAGGGGHGVREADVAGLAFGTEGIDYAAAHQRGTRKMVARPPMDFDAQFRDAFKQASKDFARKALQESGIEELASEVNDPELTGEAFEG